MNMTTTKTTETTECLSCQIESKRQAGIEITERERSHWMLWGCICTPEAVAAAQAFMEAMTR